MWGICDTAAIVGRESCDRAALGTCRRRASRGCLCPRGVACGTSGDVAEVTGSRSTQETQPCRTPAPRSKQRRHQRRRWLRLAKAKLALGTSRSVFAATLRGAPPTGLARGAELFSFLLSEPIRSGSELGPLTAQVVPEESIAATASTNRPARFRPPSLTKMSYPLTCTTP
jgi:hypothetical protein